MKKIVIILSIFALLSCGEATNKQAVENKNIPPTEELVESDSESLRDAEILNEALNIATQNIDKDTFHTEYVRIVDVGYYEVQVEINLGYHFTKNYSHLIIRRSGVDAEKIDIYSKDNNTFEKVLSHKQWEMTYVNDTIKDINGDGLKDFVVNWYGAAGCCLKAFSNVYLLRPDKKTFSSDFEFINPTFSPEEKIIRGVCYGHPGETEMYKYQWNGESVDTLEYVSYERNQNGEKTEKIIISTKRPYEDDNKVLKYLNSVPSEYKKIEGYDWFTGRGYE